MKITVFTTSGEMIEFDVDKELELGKLNDLCKSRLGIPLSNRCFLNFRGRTLTNPRKSLEDYGFMDGDFVDIFYDEGTARKISDEEKTSMKIIITASDEIIELDVSNELELENLKAMCECRLRNSLSDKCVFKLHERKLTDPKMCLKDYGIIDGDILHILDDDEETRMLSSEEKIIKLIITSSGQIIELNVSDTLELENLKAICECRLGNSLSDKCVFKLHERKLTDPKMCLKDYGIMDGDILQILSDEETIIQITIITSLGQVIKLDVSKELKLENLKVICEYRLGIPLSDKCVVKLLEKKLTDTKMSLKDYGIMDGDILEIIYDEEETVKITVITAFEERIDLNVNKGLKLENLKAMCKVKFENPSSEKCVFKWQKRILWNPKKSLKEYGITDGEILQIVFYDGNTAWNIWIEAGLEPDLLLEKKDLDFENISAPLANSLSVERSRAATPDDPVTHDTPHLEDPERIRQLFLKYPDEMAVLKERNPPLSDALESGSAERFAEVFNRQQRERYDREQERLQLQNADQSDPEVVAIQKEQERLQKVEENMEVAVEYVPESLCTVPMTYINCMVNSHQVKAFVDTGAQMTIMNRPCAVRCEIFDLVDFRWAGIAVGVGTQRILGRIHKVDIEINSVVFPSSFSILEDQPVEMILGLDFIKRNMCTIDFSRNVLQIKKANGEVVQTPFLSESELPRNARLTVPNRSTLAQVHAESKDQMPAEAFKK